MGEALGQARHTTQHLIVRGRGYPIFFYCVELLTPPAIPSRRSEARPKKEQGSWAWVRGRLHDVNGPKEDKGLQTKDSARFFAISAKMNHTVANEGQELVVQFSVKHGQKIDCGGGYIKVLPSGLRQKKFSGTDEYAIMFGPDICGTTLRRVQAIFHHAATGENLAMTKEVECETDEYSHLYTLVLRPGPSVKKQNKPTPKT